jgi:DNA-binding FadR family transcriptional regulator
MQVHERIVDTLARRDEIAAEAAIQRHIESVREIVAALADEETRTELACSF